MVQVIKNKDELQFWVGGMYQPQLNKYYLQTVNLPMKEISKDVWEIKPLKEGQFKRCLGLKFVQQMIQMLDNSRISQGKEASGYVPVAFKLWLPLSDQTKRSDPFSVMYITENWRQETTEEGKVVLRYDLARAKYFKNGCLPQGITTKNLSSMVSAAFEQFGIDIEEVQGEEGVIISEEALKNKAAYTRRRKEYGERMQSKLQSFAEAYEAALQDLAE